jgi:glycosyltransferase A (GT-A) superfamily protein (DUF2064 family)
VLTNLIMTLCKFPLVKKFLLYAPPTEQGRQMMTDILYSDEIVIVSETWTLLPVKPTTGSADSNETIQKASMSSQLTPILTNALARIRSSMAESSDTNGSVVFLGMDSPQLNLEELDMALSFNAYESEKDNQCTAYICPCPDGGYGMISIPACVASGQAFRGVVWSQSLTALSQIKALTDANPNVRIQLGRLMYDIDEPDDLLELCQRLLPSHPVDTGESICSDNANARHVNCLLATSSVDGIGRTSDCPKTRIILTELGFLANVTASVAP